MNHRLRVFVCLFILIFSGFFCSTVDVTGGSSSTDNGKVVGKIYRYHDIPAPHTRVSLRLADADPMRDSTPVSTDTTDSTGSYSFDNIAAGEYVIEAVNDNNHLRALVPSVSVDTGINQTPAVLLEQPGTIEIRVSDSSSCYVYIPGTSRYATVHNGIGFIDSVPAGVLPSVYVADQENPTVSYPIVEDLSLSAGSTKVIIDYSPWLHAKEVILNTTPTGAGISSDAYNFPVLIRLSEVNFNFSEAQPDGSDLRFKKSDETPLPYEIERWDPTSGLAEVWVKIDTIYGNDSTRSFTMLWSNPAAASESDGTAVFDTAQGFQGVWHLGEEGNDETDDATNNHYNGTPYNTTTGTGAIGNAHEFDGSSSYISMPSTSESKLAFPQNGSYSMSLWVYTDTLDTIWHAIAGKGHEQYYMQLKCLGENRATWEFVEFQENTGWEYTEDSVPPSPGAGEWLHLVGVRSGDSQFLYINGKLAVNSASLMPGEYPRDSSGDFSIGRFDKDVTFPFEQGWSYFRGKIDEVRISDTARTADWIYLSYENQKKNNTLVIFKQ